MQIQSTLTSFACRRPSGHPERWLACICGMTQSSLGVLHGSVLKVRAQSAAHHLTRTRRLGDSMSHSSAFVSNSKPNLPPLRGILFKPSGMPGSSSSLDRYSVREKVQGGKRCGARSIKPCYVSVAMDAPMLEAHRELEDEILLRRDHADGAFTDQRARE